MSRSDYIIWLLLGFAVACVIIGGIESTRAFLGAR